MFFQENAGNMSHRLPFLRLVATQLQVPIFALDYRGYGLSEGAPRQAGIIADAQVCGVDGLLVVVGVVVCSANVYRGVYTHGQQPNPPPPQPTQPPPAPQPIPQTKNRPRSTTC
jgi:hypothetical protein